MFVTGLVNLYTRDIEAGLHFYRDLLGLAETFRTPTEGIPEHVELRLNGFTVGLGTVEAARNVHGVEAAPCRRSANSLGGRSRNSAPGPCVDRVAGYLLSSMAGPEMAGAAWLGKTLIGG